MKFQVKGTIQFSFLVTVEADSGVEAKEKVAEFSPSTFADLYDSEGDGEILNMTSVEKLPAE